MANIGRGSALAVVLGHRLAKFFYNKASINVFTMTHAGSPSAKRWRAMQRLSCHVCALGV
jgi:hypothetical protein